MTFLHVLCNISAIFEDIDLKFCTHMNQPLPSNIPIVSFFEDKIVFKVAILKKEINVENFGNVSKCSKFRKSGIAGSVALLILRHFLSVN